jgi:acyl dehydratase
MTRLGMPDDLLPLIGTELGVSTWFDVTQERVDAFAEATGDHQWIHVDPVRAGTGPYGGPVAHGMFVIALVPPMIAEVVDVAGAGLVLNKGLGRIRFNAPVRVGDRVRGRVTLTSGRPRPRGYFEAVFDVELEIDKGSTSALRAEVVFLYTTALLTR